MEKLTHEEMRNAKNNYLYEKGYAGTKREIRLRALETRIIEATQNFGGRNLSLQEMEDKEVEILSFLG